MRRRRLSTAEAIDEHGGLNLTPLIDVVFVVLILFILIAPMLEMDRIQLATGPSRDQRDRTIVEEASSLVIHVREDNSVLVNRQPVAVQNLAALLKSLHAKRPQLVPQLFQDKKAQFGTYQSVKNAVEEAGYEQLDLMLQPGP